MNLDKSFDTMIEATVASNGKRGFKFPLEKMKLGDSFIMNKNHRASLSNYIRLNYIGSSKRFVTRRIDGDDKRVTVRRIR